MTQIYTPALDTNSESATIENLRYPDCSHVSVGDELCDVSTPKATEVLLAPSAGYIVYNIDDGKEGKIGSVLAEIFDTESEARQRLSLKNTERTVVVTANATGKARDLAARLGIDLSLIHKNGIIKEKDVQEYVDSRK